MISVEINREIYGRLSEVAGMLQVRLKRPVSLDGALWCLLSRKSGKKGVRISLI